MNISGVLQTGVQGIQSSVQGMEQAASEIAQVGTTLAEGGDSGVNSFVEPMMDLKLYELSAEASAKVVQTADELLGTLLDTVA